MGEIGVFVLISNQIRVTDPTATLRKWCKDHLVIKNPEYSKKVRMGFWVGDTPEKIYLYEERDGTLYLPYGCLERVLQECDDPIWVRPNRDVIDYRCAIPLYDYQEAAVKAMAEHRVGILQSPAGSGKTQMGIALACALQRRTLWITHTADLLRQSKTRAEQYMDKGLIGTITEGKVQIGAGITFATVQTMCHLNLVLYKRVWDCIIVDECHRVAGSPTAVTMFHKVLNSLAAYQKYGLSATVHRADGMIQATFALLGGVIYEVPETAVADKIMKVSVLPRATGVGIHSEFLDTDGTIVYARLVNHLTRHVERNRLILSDLIENADHYNLILSDRLEHLELLMDCLPPDLRQQAVMVDGKMTSKKAKVQRERTIEDMRAGKKRYLFATYSLAKEGLDIPRLDRLYLTTPQKDYAVIAQSIGRIARTFEGKGEPVAYDYVDNGITLLVKSYKKRCTTYRKCGCEFLDGEVTT